MVITFTQGTKYKFNNQRSKPRWNTQGHCIYRVNSESISHEGHVKDISCTGACITTPQDFPIGQKVHLTIHILESDVVKVSGTVIWNRMINRENTIGIRFFNASSETQDAILQYALHTNREAVVNYWFDGWEGK